MPKTRKKLNERTRLPEAQYDAITEAAAQWCMRLHEPDCTDREREALTVWLNADPLHAFEYQAIKDIWEVSEHLPKPEPVTPQVIARPQRPASQPGESWLSLRPSPCWQFRSRLTAVFRALGCPRHERVQAHAHSGDRDPAGRQKSSSTWGTELTTPTTKTSAGSP